MSFHRITRPPRAIRKARFDNLALVPASMLPFKDEWQSIANELPEGGALILLPSPSNKQRRNCEKVAVELREKGHQVTTVPVERFH